MLIASRNRTYCSQYSHRAIPFIESRPYCGQTTTHWREIAIERVTTYYSDYGCANRDLSTHVDFPGKVTCLFYV